VFHAAFTFYTLVHVIGLKALLAISQTVSENCFFVPFHFKTDHFTKTSSGQTRGKPQKRRPFS